MLTQERKTAIQTAANQARHECVALLMLNPTDFVEFLDSVNRIKGQAIDKTCRDREEKELFEVCFMFEDEAHAREFYELDARFWAEAEKHREVLSDGHRKK